MGRKILSREEAINKIISKKEFKDLPLEDVEKIYGLFDKEEFLEEEKIKKTRDLLRKVYTAFSSEKLFKYKSQPAEWFLKKHISTRERFDFYDELYSRLFKGKNYIVYDLGCGVNGFSYEFLKKHVGNLVYKGLEPVGQLVDVQNEFFKERGFDGEVFRASLFDIDFVKKFLATGKGEKVVFLFKTLDSLEMVERDFSKKLLRTVVPLVDKVVISWATKSLVAKKNFFANRRWLKDFVEEEFKILDEFDLGSEHYLVISK